MTTRTSAPHHARLRLIDAIAADPRVGHAAAAFAARMLWEFGTDDMRACWPSQQTIADRLGISERHVRRLLAELEHAGWLRVQRAEPIRDQETGAWCRRHTNRYRWCWRRAARRSVEAARAAKPQVAPTGHSRSGRTPFGGYVSAGRALRGPGRAADTSIDEVYRPPARGEELCEDCHGVTWVLDERGDAVRCGSCV